MTEYLLSAQRPPVPADTYFHQMARHMRSRMLPSLQEQVSEYPHHRAPTLFEDDPDWRPSEVYAGMGPKPPQLMGSDGTDVVFSVPPTEPKRAGKRSRDMSAEAERLLWVVVAAGAGAMALTMLGPAAVAVL